MTRETHLLFLEQCLALAREGEGKVSPNPMVGAVLVAHGKVIGKGHHKAYGEAHAEVEAINDAIAQGNEALLPLSTLYVNLEPCTHHGKTPPCTEAILQKKIPRVVFAMKDPNPLVSGKGAVSLTRHGVKVETIDMPSAKELNKVFIKNITTLLPYIHLKLALTSDGALTLEDGTRTTLTGEEASRHTHALRSRYDAVLVGKNTVLIDDPLLTVRHIAGKNPLIIVIDTNLTLPPTSRIFTHGGHVIVATILPERNTETKNIRHLTCKANENGHVDLYDMCLKLHEAGIYGILVEGGGELAENLMRLNLIDECTFFHSPLISQSARKVKFPHKIAKMIDTAPRMKLGTDTCLQLDLTQL